MSPADGPGRSGPRLRLGIVFWISAVWIGLLFFSAVFADVLPIRDPEELGIRSGEVDRYEGPGWNAWFGGDGQGRDLFSNVVHGARPALLLGVTVTVLSAGIGGLLGVIAGYARGRTDTVIMAVTDAALAFPALILLISVRASFGNSMAVFIAIFTIIGIAPYTRIVRGATMSLADREFVEAARAMGAGRVRIIAREIVPNVTLPVMSFAFIGFAIVIAAEGGLAFINLSLEQTTWGKLISDGRGVIDDHAHLTLIPATVMFFTVLAFNFVGDAIRTAAHPQEVATARRAEVVDSGHADEAAAAPDATDLLRVQNLHTRLGTPAGVVHAVDDVSFGVAAGEALGIVGESGSGKTMILRSILGTFPISSVTRSGHIELGGTDLLRTDDATRRHVLGTDIGTVSQNPLTALNPVRRVDSQIIEPMLVHTGTNRRDAKARAVELLGQVGIPDPARRMREYPHQLSGGMRQRVTIAIALANAPRLLLADEPTTALDVTVQDQILRLLTQLRTDTGMGLVLVTHDLAVVEEFTDRVAIVYAGQIVETGTTEQIFTAPRHQYTVALMQSIPDLDLPSHSELATIEGQPPVLIEPPTGCRFAARCPAAADRCHEEPPPLSVAPDGHEFRCWYPVGGGNGADRDVLASTEVGHGG